jgi:hypothetical protein
MPPHKSDGARFSPARMYHDMAVLNSPFRAPLAQVHVQQALAAAARLLAVPDLTYAVAGLHRPVLLHIVGHVIQQGAGTVRGRQAGSGGSRSATPDAADAQLAVALVRVLELAPHTYRSVYVQGRSPIDMAVRMSTG